MPWLEEMQVIRAVRNYLERQRGFKINHVVKSTTEHGTDIIATSPKTKTIIKIEAKGQTSSRAPRGSKKGSKRYGKEFNANQKQDHFGRALLKALTYLDEGNAAGIALPGDNYDRNLVSGVSESLRRLGLVIFFVGKNMEVSTIGCLPD